MSPGSVRIPQGGPGNPTGEITGFPKFETILTCFRDEGFQGFSVHHVPGGNGRGAVIDLLFNHMSFIEFESRHQHNRTSIKVRQKYGGIAGSAWYARSQAWYRGARIECGIRFLRQYAYDGGKSLGGNCRIGRSHVGQNG